MTLGSPFMYVLRAWRSARMLAPSSGRWRNAMRLHREGRGSGGLQDRQVETAVLRTRCREQLGGHVQAGAAGGAAAGAHRQFGHRLAAGFGGLADVLVGDAIA